MNKPIQQTLIEELGLSNLPQEKQEQLAIRATEVLLKRIFLETMERLDDEGKGKYQELVTNQASPEELEKFLREKITDYDQLLEKVVADFKAEMLKA